jgi:hypothetical protein
MNITIFTYTLDEAWLPNHGPKQGIEIGQRDHTRQIWRFPLQFLARPVLSVQLWQHICHAAVRRNPILARVLQTFNRRRLFPLARLCPGRVHEHLIRFDRELEFRILHSIKYFFCDVRFVLLPVSSSSQNQEHVWTSLREPRTKLI